MALFRSGRSFGPRIKLTPGQIAKVELQFEAAGLEAVVENCRSGSVYILVQYPEGGTVAKIRLSGHSPGVRGNELTHCVVGSKSDCMARLNEWIPKIIDECRGPISDVV